MAIPTGMKIEDYVRRSTGLFTEIKLNEAKENPSTSSSSTKSASTPSFSGVLSTVQQKQADSSRAAVKGMTLEDYQVKANRIPAFQKIERLRSKGNKAGVSTVSSEGATDTQTPVQSTTASPAGFSRKMRSVTRPQGRSVSMGSRAVAGSADAKQAKIHQTIEQTAKKYGLSPELVHSVVQAESNYQPNAVSSAGAMGLMQLMPETAKEMGVTNPFDIRQNIEGGTKYLKKMLDTFDGDLKKALQAYNAGPGAVIRHKGEVPYSETRSYVQRVMASVKQRLG